MQLKQQAHHKKNRRHLHHLIQGRILLAAQKYHLSTLIKLSEISINLKEVLN
jgi:hypothetical protein